MTVRQLLKNMSQKELVHWIAYFRLEEKEYNEKREQEGQKRQGEPPVKINQVSKPKVTQAQKDGALLSQLLALSAQKDNDDRR